MRKFVITLLAAGFIAGLSSCVKEKFSTPQATNTDPNIVTNTTIAGVIATVGTNGNQCTSSLIFSAVVVGDDRSGNLYKELAIEDSTGAIMLMINGSDLYANFPVGRRLFIQMQGLYVANYGGTYEIAASIDNGTVTGISPTNLSQYVVPGKWGVYVAPKIVTIPQISTPANFNVYQNELIELDNVQFALANRNQPYANPVALANGSLSLQDCNFNSVTVFTSGYANFAGSLAPSGNGKFVCICGVYNGAAQLTVRDTTDISLTNPVCP